VGLKDGVLLELADELSQRPKLHRREQAWESGLYMGRKYQFDEQHGQLTARLAARLFEQTRSLHQLPDEYILPLEMGALLHDIGHFINAVDHEKHGAYLLHVNRLIGLTVQEQTIVENLVRYHRKQPPSTDDECFKSLSQHLRGVVTKLTALLRLADAVEMGHNDLVSDVVLQETKFGWRVHIASRAETWLPYWALEKRKVFFEQTFGVQLHLQ
jgi:exopolyphosphatase/guanosine-5'-triphosphate,3'-diphosphate pyrophosphatase